MSVKLILESYRRFSAPGPRMSALSHAGSSGILADNCLKILRFTCPFEQPAWKNEVARCPIAGIICMDFSAQLSSEDTPMRHDPMRPRRSVRPLFCLAAVSLILTGSVAANEPYLLSVSDKLMVKVVEWNAGQASFEEL